MTRKNNEPAVPRESAPASDAATRHVFLDYLRVAACFMVVLVHCCEPYYIGDAGRCQVASASDAAWVSVVEALCRACVPLFVITSSFLLFPLRRATGDFLRGRLLRVGIPFAIWCVVYAAVNGDSPARLLYNFPDSAGHLWFVPMLFGLYLLMPLLSPWAEKVSERELRGWIGLWLFTTLMPFARKAFLIQCGEPSFGAVPYLWGEVPWNRFGLFHYVSGFAGYMLLGLYFRKFGKRLSWRKTLLRAAPLWLAGALGMAFGFYLRFGGKFPYDMPYSRTVDVELAIEFCSPFVALSTIALFMVFRKFDFAGRFHERIVRPLSEASYGTYLVHILVLTWLLPHFKGRLPTPVAMLALAAATFALASAVSFVGRRIPVVGRRIFG